jgi:hypothetical protein
MIMNGIAGEIGWHGTEVGLAASLGLKIIRSEVVAANVVERIRTLATVLLQHWSTRTAAAIFARAFAMRGFNASEKRLMRFAPTVPMSPREDRMR